MKNILTDIIFKTPGISEIRTIGQSDGIKVSMLRLDEIHPVISGNKFYKLYYFLEEAISSNHKKVITFGGAFSNHLAATAHACKKLNLKCTGIVRGEQPATLSHTLLFCKEQGMQLEFISRRDYKKIHEERFLKKLRNVHGEHTLIPEGGFSIKGKEGAALIAQYFEKQHFSHVCTAVGTAATFAGLVESAGNGCEMMGFASLKNLKDIDQRFLHLKVDPSKRYSFITDYHFGGYARKNSELISFMNNFYLQNKISLDFVYTGKMMFGVNDLLQKKYFPAGSHILCIHTGGLQGNQSLPEGTLIF